MKAKNSSFIYIVLIKALTGLGTVGRKLTGYEYTHIAVSLEPELEQFVSFSRRKHATPFDAGFMYEYRDYYAFGEHRRFKAKVFEVPVSDDRMIKIRRYLERIKADDGYLFNLYSMLTMPLFHGFPIRKTHNCMSFTALILKHCGSVQMKKTYYKYSIADIDRLLTGYLKYEGYLDKGTAVHPGYMAPAKGLTEIKRFIRLNYRLCCRMAGRGKGEG